MSVSLEQCVEILDQEGVRHHVDHAEHAVRIVFLTRTYENLRGEKLAIVRVETPDDGTRCRASIERAFGCEGDIAAVCQAACSLAAITPLVNAELDAEFENLRLVVETVVEDGTITPLQLMSMVDRLVEAAETWHVSIHDARGARRAAA